MSLPTTDLGWTQFLSPILDRERAELKVLNDEYELKSPRAYMHPEILREVGDRLQQVVIAWPQLVVDSVEERLDPEGFRLPDEDESDEDLWRVWQANNLDEEAQLGRVDALVMKRSFMVVGTNEDDSDTPLVTVESPLEMFAYIDPRTRRVLAALRKWTDHTDAIARLPEQYATLYLPGATIQYDLSGKGWEETDRDEHDLGEPPVVPLVNRSRLADRYGKSELAPILPLAHAANKIATDMMVAAEFVALPLRGIFGIGPADLEDQDGNKLTALQAIMGRLLTLPVPEGKEFQFTSASLSNFHDTINSLANLVASIAGLDPNNLGVHTDSPASADAIRSRQDRLVKRCERKHVPFGGTYEQTGRLIRRFQTGDWDPRLKRLETIWRNPATPTIAQMADAAVKKRAEGIITVRQAMEDCGYTDGQIRRMLTELDAEAERDPVRAIERDLMNRRTADDVVADAVPAGTR